LKDLGNFSVVDGKISSMYSDSYTHIYYHVLCSALELKNNDVLCLVYCFLGLDVSEVFIFYSFFYYIFYASSVWKYILKSEYNDSWPRIQANDMSIHGLLCNWDQINKHYNTSVFLCVAQNSYHLCYGDMKRNNVHENTLKKVQK
jgi:hypothetical protein